MKFFIYVLFFFIFTINVNAQSSSVLDSLRYFHKFSSSFAYAYEGRTGSYYANTIKTKQIFANNKWYLDINNGVGGGFDPSPYGSTYERIDSTSGIV